MMLPADEIHERLNAVLQGPWTSALATALKAVGPAEELDIQKGIRPIQLNALKLSPANKLKQRQLKDLLRPHWETKHGIDDPSQIAMRDAFDLALTLLEIWELAIETGYLPIDSVRQHARTMLSDFLWSKAARRFIEAYDYLGIPMLAQRVEIGGLVSVAPPEPNPKGAVRFAGFLAHFQSFLEDERINTWTRFLSDYIKETNEQDRLWEYLRDKRRHGPKRTEELIDGCRRFVASLASGFHILDEDELGRFGLVHAYWLQRFFGYELNAKGYVRNSSLWDDDSWAQTFLESPRMFSAAVSPELAKVARDQFSDQVKLLEKVFAKVRAFAKLTRAGTSPLENPNLR